MCPYRVEGEPDTGICSQDRVRRMTVLRRAVVPAGRCPFVMLLAGAKERHMQATWSPTVSGRRFRPGTGEWGGTWRGYYKAVLQ